MQGMEDILDELEGAADEEERTEYVVRPDDAQSIGEAAERLEVLKETKELLAQQTKNINAEIKRMEIAVIPDLMSKAGIVKNNKGNFTTHTGGRISLRTETHVGVRAGDRERLHDWLRAEGDGSLIKESVAPATLKKHISEVIKSGKTLPDFVGVYTEVRATLTRTSKK